MRAVCYSCCMKTRNTEVKIFEYDDYRKFILDHYKTNKERNPSFSYGVLARRGGISSRGHIKLILDGKRNLTIKSIPKFAKAFGLNSAEERYFEILVNFNQTKDSEQKDALYRKLLSFSQKSNIDVLDKAKYSYYSKWHYPMIRELVLLKDFPTEEERIPSWIKSKLRKKITEKEAALALNDLLDLGLLKKEGSRFVQTTPHLTIPDDTVNFAVRSSYREMIKEAVNHIDRPLEEREMGGVTLAINKSDLSEAKQMIREFRRNFNMRFSALCDADNVYQLGIQFFDLTEDEKCADFKSDPVNDIQENEQLGTNVILN